MNASKGINGAINSTFKDIVQIAVESSLLVLINVAAVIGNLFVCLAFYRKPSLRQRRTNYFVVSLAFTDLAMALVAIPLTVTSTIANKWISGETGCKVSYFVGFISGGTSLLTTILLATNRYVRVVKPRSYKIVFSKKNSLAMTVAAWLVATAGTVTIYFFSTMKFRVYLVQPSICFRVANTTSYVLSIRIVRCVFIAVPGFVVAGCYVRVYQTIKNHNKNRSSSSNARSSYGVDTEKTTRILAVVVAGFYLCWLPILLNNILMIFNLISEATSLRYFNFHYTIPLFASSVVNPIIYTVLSREFRNEFRKMCHCGQ